MDHASKHPDESLIELRDFSGGLNLARPMLLLADNEAPWIENFFLDPAGLVLRTRYPLYKWSVEAPEVGIINSLYNWNGYWFFSIGTNLYYMGTDRTPVLLGTLSGSARPTYTPYHGQLIVGSGATLQTIDDGSPPQALAEVSNAPDGTYLMQKDNRVVVAGDPGYPDRVWQSSVGNETTWTANSDDYCDVGWQDKMSVIGIAEFADGLYIVFKRGLAGLGMYFLTSLSETAPSVKKVSSVHCPVNHQSVVDVLGQLVFMEDSAITTLLGTDTQGKVVPSQEPGKKLGTIKSSTETSWAMVYPPDRQIWFCTPTYDYVYVYHYQIDAWTYFSFDVALYSAFYHPSTGYLYFGGDDGFIYRYDKVPSSYTDDGVAYQQTIKTRLVDLTPMRQKIVKDPTLVYETLEGCDGTFSIYDDFGRTEVYSKAFTVSGGSPSLYSTQESEDNITLYSTQTGEAHEMYLVNRVYASTKFPVNLAVDELQFKVVVTGGALVLNEIASWITLGRKKV